MSAFNLPNGTPISSLPNANGVPYLTVHDDQNKHTVPSGQYWKKETSVGSGVYIWVPTSEDDKLPVKISELEDKIDDLNIKIDNIVNGSTPATTQLTGSKVEEELTQADAMANVLTFSENIHAVEIQHEEVTWQAFTVNGLTITIPAGVYARPIGGTPGVTVTIPAGVTCVVRRLV